jgi:hypothetical protein
MRLLLVRVLPLALCVACGGGGDAARPDSAIATPAAAPRTGDSTVAARPAASAPGALAPLPLPAGARATAARVARDTTAYGTGAAWARLAGGDSVRLADSALRVWRVGDGTLVAWSGTDGAGGYENEGQSLTVADLARGTRTRVLADWFTVADVAEARSGEARALLVTMMDGGRGSMHVAVVDPARGTVFRTMNARGAVQGGRIVVESFGDGEEPVTRGDRRTPLRRDTFDPATVATMPVLVVPHSAPR